MRFSYESIAGREGPMLKSMHRPVRRRSMAKTKTRYVCQACGAVHAKWAGQCSECQEWNQIAEEEHIASGTHERPSIASTTKPLAITEGSGTPLDRFSTGVAEFDRVLGGGVVPGSLTLIGGDPGIGKSTLMLQASRAVAANEGSVLYVSGEESFDQARLRAGRIGAIGDDLFLLTETCVEKVREAISGKRYSLIVVDSIQSMYTNQLAAVPGSVGQVRDCANAFLTIAKSTGVPVMLVGHVTKDGSIAGPRLLEHLVDTVLYFEGEERQALRILRGVKNRFGSTHEVGVFEMTESGLVEVANPSALFLNERPEGVSGSVVIPSVEGTRPLLVELQALVGEPAAGSPRRTVAGLNPNRVALVIAVLERRAGLHFGDRDIFVNVAGGIRIDEPAADIAVAIALASSLLDAPAAPSLAAFGEIGLAGEVRAVNRARARVTEAEKFGFRQCILPKTSAAELEHTDSGIIPVTRVSQAIDAALER